MRRMEVETCAGRVECCTLARQFELRIALRTCVPAVHEGEIDKTDRRTDGQIAIPYVGLCFPVDVANLLFTRQPVLSSETTRLH